PPSTLFPYPTLFRSVPDAVRRARLEHLDHRRRRGGRAAGAADGGDQPLECADRSAVQKAGRRMSMVTNTLGRYFAGRFLVSAVGDRKSTRLNSSHT